ncbi:MAG TPA: glycosyltransferase [Cytophagaceae bacterium]
MQKKLSIIIVNYNVCHFLEQTLISVMKACKDLDVEVMVVDNNSVDGSVEMVRTKFPEVILIENKNNLGFSKANNQAIRISKGEYILLLNPDTIVEEETFKKCCRFMDEHPDAGGLGVKMVDGKGDFLPESKRGLPSPWVAFYKIFGLAALFPKSRKFGRYHLGFLDKDQTHKVEILSGAFMFLRRKALDKVGLLDEDFFMYGEDIDLSYRILKGGYNNYYFPETRIIHYKGESTKKTSINYVFIFYKAMIIFAQKHFSSKNAGIFSFLINIAIYIRAAMAIANRFIKALFFPVADILAIYTGMYFLKTYWENSYKWAPGEYPPEFMGIAVPAYIIIWIFSVWFYRGYEKSAKISRIGLGIFIGTVIISALSNFIDPYRFSKALILLGGVWAFTAMTLIRVIAHFIRFKNFKIGSDKKKKIIVVGNDEESNRVIELMNEMDYNFHILGYLTLDGKGAGKHYYLGTIDKIKEVVGLFKVDEIIFCSKDIPADQIIGWMTRINNKLVEYKIVPDERNYIIGSNSKNAKGEFYTVNIDLSIISKDNIRNKRILDIITSVFFLFLFPVLMWFVASPKRFFSNIINVIKGKYSWVGFSKNIETNLPEIKEGIITPVTYIQKSNPDIKTISKLNTNYARGYDLYTDLWLIIRSFRNLGI